MSQSERGPPTQSLSLPLSKIQTFDRKEPVCHPRKGVRVTDVRQTLASPLSLLHEVVAQKRR
ncbi:hypothetical protein, partial [Candidatus Methylacidithermus pantelleriae]|uniref:hypothetical protein n=1 Tax=Candidatus Methylacidithermus pantelleriae TaxID=2744239 RepID=UPI001BD361E0